MDISSISNLSTNNITSDFFTSDTTKTTASNPFKSLFEDAINSVVETDNAVKENAELLATGQLDNLYQATIDTTKAQLSVSLLVNLRNKAMDSYSEIMRMSL